MLELMKLTTPHAASIAARLKQLGILPNIRSSIGYCPSPGTGTSPPREAGCFMAHVLLI
jgi:hypothetical protein